MGEVWLEEHKQRDLLGRAGRGEGFGVAGVHVFLGKIP